MISGLFFMRCPTRTALIGLFKPISPDDLRHECAARIIGGIGGNERYRGPPPCMPPPCIPPLPDEPIVVTVSEIVNVAIVVPPV